VPADVLSLQALNRALLARQLLLCRAPLPDAGAVRRRSGSGPPVAMSPCGMLGQLL
jgi:hypothetical protein